MLRHRLAIQSHHCLCTTCSQRDGCMLLASPQRALQQLVGITALLSISAGKGPFEVASKDLTCALILWADIQHFPDKLSQPCTSFIQVYHASHHTSTSLLPYPNVLQRFHHTAITHPFHAAMGMCPTTPITTITPPMLVRSSLCSVACAS